MPITLLNTRPSHQSEPLAQLLRENSINVVTCPTMQIEFCPPDQTSAKQFADFEHCQHWVVTSINALAGLVYAFPQWFENIPPAGSLPTAEVLTSATLKHPLPVKVFAIGMATAIAAESLGLQVESLPRKQFDSEDLLEHINGLQNQAKKIECVSLITGKGGRNTLKNGLLEQGYKVLELEFYQRVAAPFCEKAWENFRRSDRPVILVSSLESWRFLHQRLSQQSGDYQSYDSAAWQFVESMVVFSARIAKVLVAEGWPSHKIVVVPIQSNDGVLQVLKQLAVRP